MLAQKNQIEKNSDEVMAEKLETALRIHYAVAAGGSLEVLLLVLKGVSASCIEG